MRARSRHFFVSGAAGGLAGFAIMELVSLLLGVDASRGGGIASMAIYFAGFGLAVGAALGMTEGLVLGDRRRLRYGLIIGLILGTIGGAAGGAAGQLIFGLVPIRYARHINVDLAFALDSSGSMGSMAVFGSDPWGARKKAASKLVERLSSSERVAVIDFDDRARAICPLTSLSSQGSRTRIKAAIDRIDASGGTSLDAGLQAAIAELAQHRKRGRPQHIIFLTDGQGTYSSQTAQLAQSNNIIVHTIGLGSAVDAALLTSIAETTGGRYYPVSRAGDLVTVFSKIFDEQIVMTRQLSDQQSEDVELLTSPLLLLIVRILSWGVMGLLIGAGQGVRENTREDLRACSLGGLIGGLLGGWLFNPLSGLVAIGSGMAGRAAADIVVGACIGGSMKLAQQVIVETSSKPTTTLLSLLPEKDGPHPLSAEKHQRDQQLHRTGGHAPGRRTAAQHRTPACEPPAPAPPAQPKSAVHTRVEQLPGQRRQPLAWLADQGPDRTTAMANAYRAGYSLREIAEHFGVPIAAVKRAVT